MSERRRKSLQEQLEAEFCPPLDTTLVAALIFDLDLDYDEDGSIIEGLRQSLSTLAHDAEITQAISLEEELTDLNIGRPRERNINSASGRVGAETETEESYSSSPWLSGDNGGSEAASVSSMSSAFSYTFNSSLDFLQAIFPRLSVGRLRHVLNQAVDEDGNMDMENVVEELLSEEYVKELEERGIEDEKELSDEWTVVARGNATGKATKQVHFEGYGSPQFKPKKRKGRATTITLGDVRQRQQIRPASISTSRPSSRPAPDPWSQLTSLSTHLASLLPPYPATFFQSYFHAPDHPTPAAALRSALSAIAKAQREARRDEAVEEDSDAESPDQVHTSSKLFALLDVLFSYEQFDALNSDPDPNARMHLINDAQLVLDATGDDADRALDTILLLRDLDEDFTSMQLGMGIYHTSTDNALLSPSAHPSQPFTTSPRSINTVLPDTSQPSRPTNPQRTQTEPGGGWQTVKVRQKSPAVHSLAEFIPSYDPANSARRSRMGMRSNGNRRETLKPSFEFQLADFKMRKREALREAGRQWQRGNSRSRGGEIAFYFAERARTYDRQERELKLDTARKVVERKRFANSEDGHTIDLHGTTSAEAMTIVREILEEGWVSQVSPLTIITGRGTHSANQIAVLGPAVKNALVAEGWDVTKWSGGLIVRGRVRGG